MIKKRSRLFVNKFNCINILLIFCHISLLSGCFLFPNYQDYVNSTKKPKSIRGVVLDKAKEATGCFGLIIIKQDDGIDTLHNIFYCTPPKNSIWEYIQPGDSIFKEKGTLQVDVKRAAVIKEFVFPTRQ